MLENLVAMIKRNMNAPDLTGTIDIEDTASLVVEKFWDSYVDKEFSGTNEMTMTRESFSR